MNFIALDVETANPDLASICQIGLAHFQNGEIVSEFSSLIDPQDYFDEMNVFIHGISENDVRGAPTFSELIGEICTQLDGAVCATHTHFDRSAINQACRKHITAAPACEWLDTARVARRTWEAVQRKGYGLANLAQMLGIEFHHHNALEDAKAAGKILCAAITESGLDVDTWLKRVKQPIDGSYRDAIKHEGNPNGPLYGESLVFTGALTIPRREAAKIAAELGCEVKAGVSKKISMLVVGDQDVTKLAGYQRSSKHRKALGLIAKGHQIRIIRESDFSAMCAIE